MKVLPYALLEIHFTKSKHHLTKIYKIEEKIHEKVFNFNREHGISLKKSKLHKF